VRSKQTKCSAEHNPGTGDLYQDGQFRPCCGQCYTQAGNLNTSGNGSIMRNAPVPIMYWRDIEAAEQIAFQQSKTTHQGDEAAHCARLLTHICVKLFQAPVGSKNVFDELPDTFRSPLNSVNALAASQQEGNDTDRNWNWKNERFKYSLTRARAQPGYIGSYCMDGLAMALHCVYTTDSFASCLLKVANTRGDCDTVCAIAAQMAGAMYGVDGIPTRWIEFVQQWDNGGNIALRAYKLFHSLAPEQAKPDDAKAAE